MSREEHPLDFFFDPLALDGALLAQLYIYVVAKIFQNGSKFIQNLTPGFKNHMRNLDSFRQTVQSPKK